MYICKNQLYGRYDMYGSLFFIKSIVSFSLLNLYACRCIYMAMCMCTQFNHSYTYTLGGLVNCLHYDSSHLRQPLLVPIDDVTILVSLCGNACEHCMHIQLPSSYSIQMYTYLHISGKQIAAYMYKQIGSYNI